MPVPERPIEKTVYVSFIECVFKGDWNERLYKTDYESQYYVAKTDLAELWLVRPDELRRIFRFRKDSEVKVGPTTVKFLNDNMIEELTVDEDEKMGKSPHSKLKFD